MWCIWSPETSQGQLKWVRLWERSLHWTLYFSFYSAESEELLSEESEEVSEAVRKRSRKVWDNKMCLYSEDLQNAFRVPFVCGRILQESWHHLVYETGKYLLSQGKWDRDEWMPSFFRGRGKYAGNPQEELGRARWLGAAVLLASFLVNMYYQNTSSCVTTYFSRQKTAQFICRAKVNSVVKV